MSFLVATNVVASRPPETRQTGTPHARANSFGLSNNDIKFVYWKAIFQLAILATNWTGYLNPIITTHLPPPRYLVIPFFYSHFEWVFDDEKAKLVYSVDTI